MQKGQACVVFDGEPTVWSGYEKGLGYSKNLPEEETLVPFCPNMFDDGITKNNIKFLVVEWQFLVGRDLKKADAGVRFSKHFPPSTPAQTSISL